MALVTLTNIKPDTIMENLGTHTQISVFVSCFCYTNSNGEPMSDPNYTVTRVSLYNGSEYSICDMSIPYDLSANQVGIELATSYGTVVDPEARFLGDGYIVEFNIPLKESDRSSSTFLLGSDASCLGEASQATCSAYAADGFLSTSHVAGRNANVYWDLNSPGTTGYGEVQMIYNLIDPTDNRFARWLKAFGDPSFQFNVQTPPGQKVKSDLGGSSYQYDDDEADFNGADLYKELHLRSAADGLTASELYDAYRGSFMPPESFWVGFMPYGKKTFIQSVVYDRGDGQREIVNGEQEVYFTVEPTSHSWVITDDSHEGLIEGPIDRCGFDTGDYCWTTDYCSGMISEDANRAVSTLMDGRILIGDFRPTEAGIVAEFAIPQSMLMNYCQFMLDCFPDAEFMA